MKRSCLAVLYLACFLSVSTFGCGKTGLPDPSGESRASAVVTIGYLPITHALTVFQEKELLDATADGISIKLQKFNSWSDLTDALNAGNIDGASVLIELAMSARKDDCNTLDAIVAQYIDSRHIGARQFDARRR